MQKRFSVILKGAILSLILTVMFAALLAALMYFWDIADATASALVFIIAAVSCMAGAYASGKALGSKGLLTGAGVGIVYYIVLCIAALIIKKGVSVDTHTLIMLVAVTASGMLGGVLSMPR